MNDTIAAAAPIELAQAAAGVPEYKIELPFESLELLNCAMLIAQSAMTGGLQLIALPDGLSITGGMAHMYADDPRDIVLRIACIEVFEGAERVGAAEAIAAFTPGMQGFDKILQAIISQRSITIIPGIMPTGVMLAALDCFPQLQQPDGSWPWRRVRLIIHAAYLMDS